MTRKNKPEVKRQTEHPEGYPTGTVLEEFWDGSKEITYPDGAKEFVDAKGKSLAKPQITDAQIEAWKKMPDDEALKEGLKIFRMENMDIPEARLKLEVLKFLCEIRGVHVQQSQTQNIVAIKISVVDLPPGIKVIDTRRQIE